MSTREVENDIVLYPYALRRLAIALCILLSCWLYSSSSSITLERMPDKPQSSRGHERSNIEVVTGGKLQKGPQTTKLPHTKFSRKTVAIGFHGAYDRTGSQFDSLSCTDFFQVSKNIFSTIIEPLREKYNVLIFFHTYRHEGCLEKDNALVNMLEPEAYEFSKSKLPRIIDSYIRVIDLIDETANRTTNKITMASKSKAIDYVLLLRFDVRYKQSFNKINIEMEKVNIAFRDQKQYWELRRKVSDLFFLVPYRYLKIFRDSLDSSCCALWKAKTIRKNKKREEKDYGWSGWLSASKRKEERKKQREAKRIKAARIRRSKSKTTFDRVRVAAIRLKAARAQRAAALERNKTEPQQPYLGEKHMDICPGSVLGPACPGHFIYPGLSKAIGKKNVHFIDGEYRSSQINVVSRDNLKSRYSDDTAFLAIERGCEGYDADQNAMKHYLSGASSSGCWRGIGN